MCVCLLEEALDLYLQTIVFSKSTLLNHLFYLWLLFREEFCFLLGMHGIVF